MTNMRRIGLGLALTVASSTGGLGPATAASTAGPAGTACPRRGAVHISPPLTMTEHDFGVVDLGSYGPCRMPDGSTRTAELSAEGNGTGSCSNGHAAGRIRVAWSNGAITTGTFDVTYQSPVAVVTYPVTEGEFAGKDRSRSVLVLTPADPGVCFSTGLEEGGYQGVITFRP
jgi:hypothetical protein